MAQLFSVTHCLAKTLSLPSQCSYETYVLDLGEERALFWAG